MTIDTHFIDLSEKKCLILGSNGFIGEKLVNYSKKKGMELVTFNVKDDNTETRQINENFDDSIVNIEIESGDEASIKEAILKAEKILGGIDCILLNFNLNTIREEKTMTCENWDDLLRDWCINYFLLIKLVVEHFEDDIKRHIVYFNSTFGYTGEGEGEGSLSDGGTLLEAACSSGITGMMTSIARSIIPKGYSVNGIAVGENPEEKWPKIEWGLNLWLSGMGAYSCGEIYRVY
jgi:NAD(P)-dependent dehydrogenase (short-subunit alcohol dehydrogenase family)